LKNTRILNISQGLAYFMATATVFGWASGIVIGRAIYETIPPIGVSFWRWLIAAVCLLPFVVPKWKTEAPIVFKSWKLCLSMGLFMISASTISMVSVNFTTATNATLVNAGQPITTAVLAWLIFKDRLSVVQVAGIFVGAIGIVVMVTRADLSVLGALQFNPGDLLMLIAIVGYALYANYLRQMPKEISLSVLMFAVVIAGCLLLLPLYIIESIIYLPMPGSWNTLGWLLVLAIATSLIPVYMWNAAIPVIGVNRAAIFVNLLPIFGAGLAIIFLNEKLYVYHILAAVCVCVGILLVVIGHKQAVASSELGDQGISKDTISK